MGCETDQVNRRNMAGAGAEWSIGKINAQPPAILAPGGASAYGDQTAAAIPGLVE